MESVDRERGQYGRLKKKIIFLIGLGETAIEREVDLNGPRVRGDSDSVKFNQRIA